MEATIVTRSLRAMQEDPFNHRIAEYMETYGDLTRLPLAEQREILNAVRFCDVCSLWYDQEDPCPDH